mmetsp:Transcript_19452/g.61941  ORF Transcript_19452/g.61941 Transcript_19452/m.61941 type:complete len:209 (+) Transcript_19452:439-1065(+)
MSTIRSSRYARSSSARTCGRTRTAMPSRASTSCSTTWGPPLTATGALWGTRHWLAIKRWTAGSALWDATTRGARTRCRPSACQSTPRHAGTSWWSARWSAGTRWPRGTSGATRRSSAPCARRSARTGTWGVRRGLCTKGTWTLTWWRASMHTWRWLLMRWRRCASAWMGWNSGWWASWRRWGSRRRRWRRARSFWIKTRRSSKRCRGW